MKKYFVISVLLSFFAMQYAAVTCVGSKTIALITKATAIHFPWSNSIISPEFISSMQHQATVNPERMHDALQSESFKPLWYAGSSYRSSNGIFKATAPNLMTYREAQNILGAEGKESPQELKLKYRKAMMKAHPDQGGTTQKAQDVDQAYKILRGKESPSSSNESYSSYSQSNQKQKNYEEQRKWREQEQYEQKQWREEQRQKEEQAEQRHKEFFENLGKKRERDRQERQREEQRYQQEQERYRQEQRQKQDYKSYSYSNEQDHQDPQKTFNRQVGMGFSAILGMYAVGSIYDHLWLKYYYPNGELFNLKLDSNKTNDLLRTIFLFDEALRLGKTSKSAVIENCDVWVKLSDFKDRKGVIIYPRTHKIVYIKRRKELAQQYITVVVEPRF
ncbi:MAG TPA: DnaJ domain-containing protein [Candidatus Saccharimonadales bacterium]|nr:DnaJ domain-containing protein [Candidatus Saccharimonadales bacterium]